MTHPPGTIHAYTDFGVWDRDIRSFIVNERPVIQRVSEPTPLLTLRPDRELIALFRAHHQMPNPTEGGDVVVEHRIATHGPSRTARAMTKYIWTTPMAYTMTITLQLPESLDWLGQMLPADGCWCCIAPRPDLGLLWLPAPEGLLEHFIIVASAFRFSRGGQ